MTNHNSVYPENVAVDNSTLSEAVEDYLKGIYALESTGTRVTTSALARRMRVSAPSATAMAKRLAQLGLVERRPYRGLALTAAGRKAALEVIRHHRLLERYLADALGLALDEVHAEADALEHAISEQLEARIDEALGYPTHDPHGDPIPDRELRLAEHGQGQTIVDLQIGERSSVTSVPDEDAELLRYLATLGLVPGGAVTVIETAPFGGPLTILTASGTHAISREIASSITIAA